ncbi:LamB/YcsF family protein [Limosilactobacillus fermentum]|uniref:LamB/YcsF family protein n=1 Tax=Limosilactobacillus fermentum TaxID=1613 RepID=UPI001C0C9ACE|nr:5-oxoprolinase subunit PxpA [Limosilactobacillus fermentum]QWQ33427.1 5-oxoprolinase subunit PxpA [Limosilactobacillus fermentum]
MTRIDLNSDLGESFGRYTIGNDDQVLDLITAANVACGFHAGDPDVMAQTVALAEAKGVAIGAHPGFPDLGGFGRRKLDMAPAEVKNMVTYQVSALMGFTKDQRLHHVKPHGALYNAAAKDLALARAICEGVAQVDDQLPLYGLAGSQLLEAAKEVGLPAYSEVFADRGYQADGSLVPRSQPNAVLTDPLAVAERALSMVQTQSVTAVTGETVPLKVDTICVHGDNQAALALVDQLRQTFTANGITIQAC